MIPHLQTENTSFFFHVRKREGFEGAAAPFDALGSQALRLGMWEILMGGSVVPKQLSLSNLNIAEKVSKLKLFFFFDVACSMI